MIRCFFLRRFNLFGSFNAELICLFVCVLWHINFCRLFNAKSIFFTNKQFYFKTIQFSISTQFNCQKHFCFQVIQLSQIVLIKTIQFSISIIFVHTQLNVKTVLFQIIQFIVSTVSM